MKSGPTLAAAGRRPAARRAARRPVVTVVLPTPEGVPATTIRGPSVGTKSTLAARRKLGWRARRSRIGEVGARRTRSRHCDRGASLAVCHWAFGPGKAGGSGDPGAGRPAVAMVGRSPTPRGWRSPYGCDHRSSRQRNGAAAVVPVLGAVPPLHRPHLVVLA